MPEAAHKTHQVAHSLGMAALIGGAIVGGVLAAGFIVFTGGTGAIVIASAVATGVSAGGGLGKMVGSHFSGTPSGPIMFNCVDSVLIEGLPAATVGSLTMCTGAMMGPPHPSSPIVQGSSTVFIGGKPAARKGDKLACSAKVDEGCSSVIIGGETVTVAPLNPEVPEWVDWGLMGLGMLGGFGLLRAGGMGVLAAASRIGGATAGGMGGSMLAGYGAEQLGYEPGSWGHDLATLGGGMLGGYGGYKGGGYAAYKYGGVPGRGTGAGTGQRVIADDGYRVQAEKIQANSRSLDDVTPTPEGLAKVKEHLSRPEFLDQGEMAANNRVMIERQERIQRGELEPTITDRNFYAHEMREQQLMRGGMSYEDAHAQTCKEYGISAADERNNAFYTPEAMDAWHKQMMKNSGF